MLNPLCISKFVHSLKASAIAGGHVEMQTMQTADCRLQTVQTVQTVRTVQTECNFFYLYVNFLVKLLL